MDKLAKLTRSGLPQLTPSFRAAIDAAAMRVFGHQPVVPHRTGNKYLLRKPLGPVAVHFYPPDPTPRFRNNIPGFKTDIEQRTLDRRARRRKRGKFSVKKGQGKRATKGKKGK